MQSVPSLHALSTDALVSRSEPVSVPSQEFDFDDAMLELYDSAMTIVLSALDQLYIDIFSDSLASISYLDYKVRIDCPPLYVKYIGNVATTIEVEQEAMQDYKLTTVVAYPGHHRVHTEKVDIRWARAEAKESDKLLADAEAPYLLARGFLTPKEVLDVDREVYEKLTSDNTPAPESMEVLRSLGFAPFTRRLDMLDFSRPLTRLGHWTKEFYKKRRGQAVPHLADVLQVLKLGGVVQSHVTSALQELLVAPGSQSYAMAEEEFYRKRPRQE